MRALARRRVPRAVFDYVDGAAGDEEGLRASRRAFRDYVFVPRVLRDVREVDTSKTMLGKTWRLPFVFGPTGFTRMMHHAGEPAVAAASDEVGIPYALSTLGTTSIEELRGSLPNVDPWFQLYLWKDRAASAALLDRVRASGCDVLILTVDTPVGGLRLRDERNGLTIPPKLTARTALDMAKYPRWWMNVLTTPPLEFGTFRDSEGTVADLVDRVFEPSITPQDVEWLRSQWPGRLVVKGIQSVEDAVLVRSIGADAIVLSNHGGRQVERGLPPMALLPAVLAAVDSECEVFVDGGATSGADVLIALALGARGVWFGRAYLYGLMAGGRDGVLRVARILEKEIATNMRLVGVTNLDQLNASYVTRYPQVASVTNP